MAELTAILVAKRKGEHNERRFLAALQGQDIGDGVQEAEGEERVTFEDIKARVFSGGQAKNAKDILSMQGINAQQAGFGIGLGLEYTDAKDLDNPSW